MKNSIRVFYCVLSFIVLDWGIGSVLEQGLFRYYGLGTAAELALIGHSHLMLGVDKVALEEALGIPVAKYTREGVNVADRALMIEQLLQENPSIKQVIYAVDAWMFTGEGLSANSYKLFYPFMDQKITDQYVYEQADFFDYWQHKLIKTSRYNELLVSSAVRGYLNNWSNLKAGTVDTLQLQQNISLGNIRKIQSTEENKQIFENSVQRLLAAGITVTLVYVPTISFYNQAEPDKFQQERFYFQTFAQQHSQVQYWEFIDEWENRHSYFFDPIHLNPSGQQAFTSTLSLYLTNP